MDKEILIKLTAEGLSTYQIAKNLQTSQTNIRYWLRKYSIKTISNKRNRTEQLCKRCNQTKPVSDFYQKRRSKGFVTYCKKCSKEQVIERQRRFKKLCVDYKGGKCADCDYDRCIAALEFHHIDPFKKDFTISEGKLKQFTDKIKKELDKCLLVCCRCHRERHNL